MSEADRKVDDEVDHSLLDWFASLSWLERLRVTSRNTAMLERLRRAASKDG